MLSLDEKMLLKAKYDMYFKHGFLKGFFNYHIRYSLTLSIFGLILMAAREGFNAKAMGGFLVFFALLFSLVSVAHILQFLAANYCGKIGRCLVKPF